MRATAAPTIDPAFTGTGTLYWSSTPGSAVVGGSSYAWYVSFNEGAVSYGTVSSTYRVRCVR